MDGFEKMIDIFDGVTVTSNATFSYNGSSLRGTKVKLDGDKALNYVRSRKEKVQVVTKVVLKDNVK